MAELQDRAGLRSCFLWPEHLIGRSEQCALRLAASYVSAQHAVIRWNGRSWELLDRGSRNGTQLDGKPVEAKRAYPLACGAVLAFGHADEVWRLRDDGPPEAMVVALDTGEVLRAGAAGVIGIPSKDEVRCTVYLGNEGAWQLEQPDGTLLGIGDGHLIELVDRRFRFCCPSGISATASLARTKPMEGGLLCFKVSSDEEFVELSLEYPTHSVGLGSRSHNYLLLTLADARLRDLRNNVADSACGWVDKEELAHGLRMTAPQVDGEVFRIRRHIGKLGLPEMATIIERRPRTRQMRIGFSRIRIERP